MATAAEKLKQVREEERLSSTYIAKKLGVHAQTYRRWENGETEVPYDQYVRIMTMFGYDVVEVKDFRENRI